MMKNQKKTSETIGVQLRRLVVKSIPLLIIYSILSGAIMVSIKRQSMNNIDELSQLYIDEIDNQFFKISRRILLIMVNNNGMSSEIQEYIEMAVWPEDEVAWYYAVDMLKEEFLQFTWEYGSEYHFFVYASEADQYLNLDIDSPADGSRSGFEEILSEQIDSQESQVYYVKKKWDSFTFEEDQYIYKAVNKNGVHLGCYVNVKDLLAPFASLDLGRSGYVQLTDQNGKVIERITSDGIEEELTAERGSNEVVSKQLERAPFAVEIYISTERLLLSLAIVLVIVIFLAVIFLGLYVYIFLYLRRNVLRPIEEFTARLLSFEEQEYTYEITESKFRELEQLDSQFQQMLRQIKKLKITIYEQEIEQRNMEIENLKLQIRPHFFLNCLNFIYSMQKSEKNDIAMEMLMLTSDYLRYVFRSDSRLVKIEDEIQHCRNYLDIYKLRYGSDFEYYIDQDAETSECYIFPYLLYVFVENAIKHAVSLDRAIHISLTVYPEVYNEKPYINIYLCDDGEGFSEEVLELLNKGEVVIKEDGKHIGIYNCVKRIHYYFGDEGIIRFSNSPLGGAVVDIHIPVIDKEGVEQ